MNAAKQKTKFEEHLNQIVDAFGKECQKNKRVALRLKISAVFLSAVVTVCLGLKFGKTPGLQAALSNVALALSAVITVVGAYEAFFDPRAIWIRETIVFTRLRNLKREFEFWAAGCDAETLEPGDVAKLEGFKKKMDQILIDSLKNWMKIRGVPDSESKLDSKESQAAQEEADGRANISKNA
jgi:predicted membrane chloride channel (bestrophin family)